MPLHHNISASTIRGLWNYWAIAFGAIALVMLCSLFISKTFLPIILFALAYALMTKIKSDNTCKKMRACYLMVWAMAIILFWSGLVMLIINISMSQWFFGGVFAIEPFNPRHPYICSLIIFPIALIVSLWFLAKGHKMKICRHCQARFGYYDPAGTVANLYYRESRYQLRLLLWLSLVLSIVDWAYYYFFYINVNFNKPDKFYFIIMPIAVYLLSLVYMSVRYMAMSEDMTDNKSPHNIKPMMTMLRFLVFSGDRMLLAEATDNSFDTPAKMLIPRREKFSDEEARKSFADMSGIDDFELKYLYTDTGYINGANVIHFAVFLPDDTDQQLSVGGEWQTIDIIDRELKAGKLAPLFVSELNRIYHVTMAWKTYDRKGRRLYPIKNYQPTFRLRDFKKWDVDYGDLHWLDIATNNQDSPFFRLRRFWRKNFNH